MDLAADRRTWENLTNVQLDDLEFATTWNEKSPMHMAIEMNHTECAEYILSNGKGTDHEKNEMNRSTKIPYHHDGKCWSLST